MFDRSFTDNYDYSHLSLATTRRTWDSGKFLTELTELVASGPLTEDTPQMEQ